MRAASAALQMDPSVSEIRGLIDRFTVDMTALGRLYPVSFSPARSARMKAHMVETTKALQAVNFEGLDDSGKIDWLLCFSAFSPPCPPIIVCAALLAWTIGC